ncbi:MAG: hypothetical protein IJB73_03455 [Firmicutes bacterium]|nr:hypothetical protein [Bacillota bacterium]
MENNGLKKIGKNAGRIMKATAALIAAAAFVVASSITPTPEAPKDINSEIFNPTPVVMTIEEASEAIVEEETDVEEEVKKKGFFVRLKMAIYGFFAACAAWVAHKIPWKKIFNRRNFYILLALVCTGLAVYFLWPVITDYLAQPNQPQ